MPRLDLPAIYAPLDPAIAPLVLALRRDGFPTLHSCAGHTEDAIPFVVVEPWDSPERPFDYYWRGCIGELLTWATEHQITANVALVYGNAGTPEDQRDLFPFLRLEVLSDLKDAVL